LESVELGLAQVGLNERDIRRLRAMMMVALADGSLRKRWGFVEASCASVIIVDIEAAGQVQQLAAGGRIVAVLAGAADAVPPGVRTLSWPIRAEALLELMQEAERRPHLQSGSAPPDDPLIQVADLLRRTGSSASQEDAWQVTGLCRAPIFIAPQRRRFYCTDSLRTLHRFDGRSEIKVSPIALADLPSADEQPKPIVMLQWSVGLLTGALGPLPWLKASASFRLQRFPEFQVLHHEPAHRRLAAAFSRPVAGIDAAVELTKLSRPVVCSFVNAAELCGYLRMSEEPQIASRAPAWKVSGSRRALVQILRRALGIEAIFDG
jgi:hypothetical protein